MLLFQKSSPIIQLSIVYVFIGILLRIVLMFHPITQSSFSFLEIIPIFILGIISDFFVFVIMSSFLWLYFLFLSNSKFDKPWGYLIFLALVSLLLYLSFFNTILNDYGGSLPEIVIAFIVLKTLLF